MTDCDKYVFDNKKKLKEFLHIYLSALNRVDEFIVFAHQVNDFSDRLYDKDPQTKLESILNHGLSLYRYGSLDGTTYRLGSSLSPDIINDIANYNYHNVTDDKCYPTVMLALPRYITLNGEQVEYSTSKYVISKEQRNLEPLTKMLESKNGRHVACDNQYTSKCWADIIHGFRDLTPHETLFAFYRTPDDKYTLLVPHTHWAEQPQNKYKEYKENLSKKVESYGLELEDALAAEESRRKAYIDSLLDNFD